MVRVGADGGGDGDGEPVEEDGDADPEPSTGPGRQPAPPDVDPEPEPDPTPPERTPEQGPGRQPPQTEPDPQPPERAPEQGPGRQPAPSEPDPEPDAGPEPSSQTRGRVGPQQRPSVQQVERQPDAGPGRQPVRRETQIVGQQQQRREAAIRRAIAERNPNVDADEVEFTPTGDVRLVSDFLEDDVLRDPSVRGRIMGTRRAMLQDRREVQAREQAAEQLREQFGLPGGVDITPITKTAGSFAPLVERVVPGEQSETAREIQQAIEGFGQDVFGIVFEQGDEIRVSEVNPRLQAASQRFGGIGAAGGFGATGAVGAFNATGVALAERKALEDIPTTGYQAELTPSGQRQFYSTVAEMEAENRPTNPATGEEFLSGVDSGADLTFDEEGQITAIDGQPLDEGEEEPAPDQGQLKQRLQDSVSQISGGPGPGPLGDIDRAISGGVTSAADIALDTTDAAIGAVEQSPIGDFAGEVEGLSQAILGPIGPGPIGDIERSIGGYTYETAKGLSIIGQSYDEAVFHPAAKVEANVLAAPYSFGADVSEAAGIKESEAGFKAIEGYVRDTSRKLMSGAGTGLTETTFGLPAAGIQTAETAGAGAEFTATAISEAESPTRGAIEAGTAGTSVGVNVAEQAARMAVERPVMTGGIIVGSYPAGILGGRALGAAGRRAAPYARTVGGTEVDLSGVVNPRTRQYFTPGEPDPADAEFPSAADEALYETRPAQALRRQADEYTPDEIQEAYEAAGVEQGSVVKKALGGKPEGPARGRAAQGYESVPDETGLDPTDLSPGEFSYEAPGSFVSPEWSLYFTNEIKTASATQSLRPGLPDVFTGQPTGVFIRTEVEEPDARTLDEFQREMVRREGETTVRTKPPGVGNTGEIEAVAPPGATYADIGSATGGPLRNTLRRLGIGADYYTQTPQGTRVPLRLVAPEGDIDVPGRRSFRDFLRNERGQLGAADEATGGRLIRLDPEDIARRSQRTPRNRPLVSPFKTTDIDSEPAVTRTTTERSAPSDYVSEYVAPSEFVSRSVSEPVTESVSEASQPSQPSERATSASSVPSLSESSYPGQSSQPGPPVEPYTPPPSTPSASATSAPGTSAPSTLIASTNTIKKPDLDEPKRREKEFIIEVGDFEKEFESNPATPEEIIADELTDEKLTDLDA